MVSCLLTQFLTEFESEDFFVNVSRIQSLIPASGFEEQVFLLPICLGHCLTPSLALAALLTAIARNGFVPALSFAFLINENADLVCEAEYVF